MSIHENDLAFIKFNEDCLDNIDEKDVLDIWCKFRDIIGNNYNGYTDVLYKYFLCEANRFIRVASSKYNDVIVKLKSELGEMKANEVRLKNELDKLANRIGMEIEDNPHMQDTIL